MFASALGRRDTGRSSTRRSPRRATATTSSDDAEATHGGPVYRNGTAAQPVGRRAGARRRAGIIARSSNAESPWAFCRARRFSSPACSATARSPTASPRRAAAKAPSSPSPTRATASRTASTEMAQRIRLGPRLPLRRRQRRADRRAVRRARASAGTASTACALHRLRAARGDRRRFPRRPLARGLPHRARRISSYSFAALAKARAAADGGPQRARC